MRTHTDAEYAAFFCEENVWRLAQRLVEPTSAWYATFVSNPDRTCAMWQQRAVPDADPVIWDYHVVLLRRCGASVEVYDLDSRLPFPSPLQVYLRSTFPLTDALPDRFHPRFRLVEASEYLDTLSSDRSHMRQGEAWRAPPPSWPAIAAHGQPPTNLERFVDMSGEGPGQVLSLPELTAWARA